ncbi:hypothetical protein [Salaquimonas pukyongi]|uniref:hypothetical protein n=1 Tax=Salaquimonas pukyongi TaxID=2712698 RepID=UPI001968A44A|nr:hypothetical protein [Salaquimonas pukyongi]
MTGKHRKNRGAAKAAALVLAGLLAACNSAGTNKVENTLDVANSGQSGGAPAIDEIQDPRAFCPQTVLRAGTETYDIYPEGVKKGDEGASSQLKFRATISEVARECNSAGTFLNIRVGVRGRFLSGPSGEPGSFTMPLRVAVTQGENVLYSQLHQIPAEILPGKLNGTFSFVDNNVSIPKPESKNVVVYVGYDEGPYDTP